MESENPQHNVQHDTQHNIQHNIHTQYTQYDAGAYLCYGVVYNEKNHQLVYGDFLKLRYTPIAMVYANADQCFIVLNESWRLCKPDAITPVEFFESTEATECGVEGCEGCNTSSAAMAAKWAALDWDFLEGQLGLLKTVRDTPAGWHVWFPFFAHGEYDY
jgi:hypothetical protein